MLSMLSLAIETKCKQNFGHQSLIWRMLFSQHSNIDPKKWTQLEEAEVESTNTFGKGVFTKTENCHGDIEIGDYLNAYEDKFAYFN